MFLGYAQEVEYTYTGISVQVLQRGYIVDYKFDIVPHSSISSDQTSTSNMKIDTLNFLTVLLTHHSPSVLHPHIGAIIPAVVSSVDDSFYKITSEALLVLQLIVKTIRPLGEFDSCWKTLSMQLLS